MEEAKMKVVPVEFRDVIATSVPTPPADIGTKVNGFRFINDGNQYGYDGLFTVIGSNFKGGLQFVDVNNYSVTASFSEDDYTSFFNSLNVYPTQNKSGTPVSFGTILSTIMDDLEVSSDLYKGVYLFHNDNNTDFYFTFYKSIY